MTTRHFLLLLLLACGIGSARSWSGYLVDGGCYASLERNHSPTDTMTDVDRDRGSEVLYCRPTRKTRAFAVVQEDGQSFKLDGAGNVKAAGLVRAAGRQRSIYVTVTGRMTGGTASVQSIAASK